MADDTTENGTGVVMDPGTVSMLQALFSFADNQAGGPAAAEGAARTASVKFMITLKDEEQLRALGYSQAQIDRLKPAEAHAILQCGTVAEPDTP